VAGLPLADAGPLLDRLTPALLFSDVDGTLVGRDGALLADLEGRPTLAAAEALVAARRAGLEVVLVSGRTGEQLRESGRLLGARDAIGELGTVLVRGREIEVRWGEAPGPPRRRRWSAPARWAPCWRASPAGWSRTRRGTSAAAAPPCSAARSTRPRPTPCSPRAGSAGRACATTAACAAPTRTSAPARPTPTTCCRRG
jgi:hypothetical protein